MWNFSDVLDWFAAEDDADCLLAHQLHLRPWLANNRHLGWISHELYQANPELAEWFLPREKYFEWSGPLTQASLLRLESALYPLHRRGTMMEWRQERFAIRAVDAVLVEDAPILGLLERGLFRLLGLSSRAVHLNVWQGGIHPSAKLWVATRSLDKQVDPGKLDNTVAGGIGETETHSFTLVREAWEEAGLRINSHQVQVHSVLSLRMRAEGLHREGLWIGDVVAADGWQPANQDGEVSQFVALDIPEVIRLIQNGAFTRDAALTIVSSLVHYLGGENERVRWIEWLNNRKINNLLYF